MKASSSLQGKFLKFYGLRSYDGEIQARWETGWAQKCHLPAVFFFPLCLVYWGQCQPIHSALTYEVVASHCCNPMTHFDNKLSHVPQVLLCNIFYFWLHYTLFPDSGWQASSMLITNLTSGIFPSNENSEIDKDYRIDLELTVIRLFQTKEAN